MRDSAFDHLERMSGADPRQTQVLWRKIGRERPEPMPTSADELGPHPPVGRESAWRSPGGGPKSGAAVVRNFRPETGAQGRARPSIPLNRPTNICAKHSGRAGAPEFDSVRPRFPRTRPPLVHIRPPKLARCRPSPSISQGRPNSARCRAESAPEFGHAAASTQGLARETPTNARWPEFDRCRPNIARKRPKFARSRIHLADAREKSGCGSPEPIFGTGAHPNPSPVLLPVRNAQRPSGHSERRIRPASNGSSGGPSLAESGKHLGGFGRIRRATGHHVATCCPIRHGSGQCVVESGLKPYFHAEYRVPAQTGQQLPTSLTQVAVSTSRVCRQEGVVDVSPAFNRHMSSFQHRRCRPHKGVRRQALDTLNRRLIVVWSTLVVVSRSPAAPL